MKRVILASNSPRRRELMARMDIPFTAKGVQTEEFLDTSLPLGKAIEQIARQKALAVREFFQDDVIIGADTIVCIDGEVLGKPRDEQQAFEMLKRLSGRTHQVITGVAVLYPREEITFYQTTDVTFYQLSDEEIRAYAATNEPLDKAGAYGIQGKGAFLVEKIAGDYYNVMGLPMAHLYRVLNAHR